MTGTVLLFVPFPALSEADRLAASEPIKAEEIELSPSMAVTGVPGDLEKIKLIQAGAHPVYLLWGSDGNITTVCADSGLPLPALSPEDALGIGEHFSGVKVKQVEGPMQYDQWIVHQQFDPYRPFYRVSLQDQAGTVLYISARTGQVLQRTHFYERMWNWVGAVIHWIYPTILRQNWQLWNEVVWWLALVGVATALAGMVVGLARLIVLKRRGKPGFTPFRGWLRWHHLLGLSGGVFMTSWIFSGWLSMDHGRIFSTGEPKRTEVQQFRGISLREAARQVTIKNLRQLPSASEFQIVAIGGQSFLIARGAGRAICAIDRENNGKEERIGAFPDKLIRKAIESVWAGQPIVKESMINPDDAYTGTDSLPATTCRYVLGSGVPIWVHVDLSTGEIVSVMDRSRRIYAWLYYGLHTFSFPILTEHPILRRVIMLVFLGSGFALSLTGVILGLKRLVRTFVGKRRAVP